MGKITQNGGQWSSSLKFNNILGRIKEWSWGAEIFIRLGWSITGQVLDHTCSNARCNLHLPLVSSFGHPLLIWAHHHTSLSFRRFIVQLLYLLLTTLALESHIFVQFSQSFPDLYILYPTYDANDFHKHVREKYISLSTVIDKDLRFEKLDIE
ncbi:hypothetical protein CPB84DRAFT_1791908, partial [Gymnopilus junonius]